MVSGLSSNGLWPPNADHFDRKPSHLSADVIDREATARLVPCVGPTDHATDGERGHADVCDVKFTGIHALVQQIAQDPIESLAHRIDIAKAGFGEALFFTEINRD